MENKIELLVKQLTRGSNTRVYNALISLRKKYLRDQENVVVFREHGGPQALIGLIQRPNNDIVELALSILGNCCLEEDTRKIVGRVQGIDHIVRILECVDFGSSMLNRACRVVANLALDDRIATYIVKGDAVKLIVRIMEADGSDDFCLKLSATRSLRIIASTPSRRELVVKVGAVRCLGKLLQSEDASSDATSVVAVLRCLVVLTQSCSLDCAEQLQSDNCLEKLISLSAVNNECCRNHALHILANLSHLASMRPLLGSAGLVISLVVQVDRWDKQDPGWQWAVDSLCQCTREAVNRVKVREGGGLKHLVALLREPVEERLWLCSLSSIVNFLYDEASFSCLVDLGMVAALVDKLIALSAREKEAVHGTPSDGMYSVAGGALVPGDGGAEESMVVDWGQGGGGSNNKSCASQSPHACCYSPESSPPYWTSFPSCSSPSAYQRSLSPSAMSPVRDASPDPVLPGAEVFCYSPVYESCDSDDDDDDNGLVSQASAIGTASVNSDSIATPPSVSSERDDVLDVPYSKSGVGNGRSPINDILHLLSRLSLEETPRQTFLCRETLTALLEYVVGADVPLERAKRILGRVARNPLCFECLVLLDMPLVFRQKLVLTPHGEADCSACKSVALFGRSFMGDLRRQAESPFGGGVLRHLILAGRNQKEKLLSIVAAIYLVRSSKSRKHILLDTNGLGLLTEIIADVDHSDFNTAVDGISCLGQLVLPPGAPTSRNDQNPVGHPCHYAATFRKRKLEGHGGDDVIRLTVGDRDGHVAAHRHVLSQGCDVFDSMLRGDWREASSGTVSMANTSLEAVQYVVHHLYGCRPDRCPCMTFGAVSSSVTALLSTVALGDRLLLNDVKSTVADQLMCQHLPLATDVDIVDAFLHSKLYSCPSLGLWVVKDSLVSTRLSAADRRFRFRELSRASEQFVADVGQTLTEAIMARPANGAFVSQ